MICGRNLKARRKRWFSYFTHLAEEVREILASLGFTTLQQVIGRTDLLTQVSRGDACA
jgi:glutamate synthase (NADPH/NADH) large chain